jgi:hypothetical protein
MVFDSFFPLSVFLRQPPFARISVLPLAPPLFSLGVVLWECPHFGGPQTFNLQDSRGGRVSAQLCPATPAASTPPSSTSWRLAGRNGRRKDGKSGRNINVAGHGTEVIAGNVMHAIDWRRDEIRSECVVVTMIVFQNYCTYLV